tara:strand:- start:6044 stop:6823 length:780 start_codon:yes stop_codon:yes gene_type:complete
MKYGLAITTYNNFSSLINLLNDFTIHEKLFDIILIVDDCSNNANQEFDKIKNLYKKKFKNLDIKIFDQNFGGATRSRNYAIEYFKKINFDYLTFLDQDDKLDRKFLVKIHSCLSRNIKIDAINSNYQRKSIIKKKDKFKNNLLRELIFNDFKYHNFVSMSGFTLNLKNNFLTRFNEDKKFNAIEDYDFYLSFLKEGYNFYLLNLPLIEYGYYYSNYHLSHNKFKMLIKFSRVNLKNFSLIGYPFRIFIWILINLKKRIF